MSLTRKVAYNTLIQIIGKVVTTAASLVLIMAITRYLGVSGYGQYTTIFAYVSFWSVLADFGFFWILVREISKPGANVEKIFNNIITLRSLLGLFIFILASGIAFLIPSYPMAVKIGIGICAAGWFWMSSNSTYVGVFQSNLKMHFAVIGDVVGRIVILGLVLMLVKMNASLSSIIWAYFFGNLVNFFISIIFGRAFVRFRLAFDFSYWREIFWETLPMALVLVLGILYFKIDTVMLSLFKSSEDVGIYGAPFKILEILLLLPSMFMGNVFPIITKYIVEKDKRFASAIQKSFDFLAIIAAPIVGAVLILATPIIKFIAGDAFVSASTLPNFFGLEATAPLVLQILIVTVGVYFLSQVFNNTVIAMGCQKDLVKPYLLFVVVNVGLNVIFIPLFSYIGAALVTIITAILVLVFTAKIVFRYHPVRINYTVLLKSIAAAVMMMLVLHFVKMELFLALGVGGLFYAVMLYAIGGVNRDSIKSIIGTQNENRN